MHSPINPSTPPVRHLSVCLNTDPSLPPKCSVLLVEPPTTPRSNKERLLSTADYCVTAVRDVRDIFDLRFDEPVLFAVLNDLLGPFGLRAAAETVRRQWPFAKILVVGSAAPALEDHLYDEAISHRHEEDGFLEAFKLLTKGSWNLKLTGGYAGYRRAAASLEESDPTKSVMRASVETKKRNVLPIGLPRLRATA